MAAGPKERAQGERHAQAVWGVREENTSPGGAGQLILSMTISYTGGPRVNTSGTSQVIYGEGPTF